MRTSRRNQDPDPDLDSDDGTAPSPPARGRRAHAGPPADELSDKEKKFTGPHHQEMPPRAGRWRVRPRTVRAKIVCLLMVPVVSLLALWGYATVSTAQDVARLRQLQRVHAEVRAPVDAALTSLQAERAAAVRYATERGAARGEALEKQATRTDRAVAKLRLGDHRTVADGAGLPAGVVDRLGAFVNGAENLRSLRTDVLDRRKGWDAVYTQYTKTISQAFAVGGALTGMHDSEPGSHARVLLEFSRASEMLAREDAVLAAARRFGTLDGKRLRLFTGAVDTRRALSQAAVADLRGPERAAWRSLEEGSEYGDLQAVEDKVLAAEPGREALAAAPARGWGRTYAAVRNELHQIEESADSGAVDRTDPFTHGVLTPAGAAVLLGLAAVAASLVISVRIGRGLVIELVSLRNGALEIARRKLPNAMRRLRAGEEIDIHAEAPPRPPVEDETGQVSEALDTVHRAALHAAIERAELASGISGVFVNLARRSQILVHRQLNLLDTMERRADDPDELSDLFRLDHLTTRMRRHAESLIILSGAAPGRAWRMPVSLTDVVRAAVSEVEDYARVEVRQLPTASVLGTAVADLTHLLAELVENAAQFSPPHTKVRVSGEPVGNGYALEVEDRGLGMGPDMLAEANRRIEHSEALDLFDSDQLGLFVVSRLTARHGIKVQLRTSPYGGTTAVVLLPTALLHSVTAENAEAHTGRRMNGTPVPAAASHPALPIATQPPPPGVTALRPPRGRDDGPYVCRPYDAGSLDIASTDIREGDVASAGDQELDIASADAQEAADALPRRLRQASLAPQLRERHSADAGGPTDDRADEQRSPEQVRDRMTAYRDGWARGGGPRPGVVGSVPDISGPVPGRDSSEGDPA
ncbi:sensor histidine kinase [Streptomyces alboniger]|uniref:histidine kinase n=1 Tax=Streptomyces alboniger TaxID=132473 RepID=A0A5J6HA71_STRAD|nr:nitrate- and nitrite sensing domain-containing protein [Streptomyces alboniger]QEV16518.1 sensor histidine kinase [Streptomyces alboniger]